MWLNVHGDEFVWDEFVGDELFGDESSRIPFLPYNMFYSHIAAIFRSDYGPIT